MPTARVETGARLHFGFQNLSLARDRLYGGVGVALAEPRVVVEASPADRVRAPDPLRQHAERACEYLDVPGVRLRADRLLPLHCGLGSGTQHALATLIAVARAHDRTVDARRAAPTLGRGGRSGVGVATVEEGGFVVDGGHPVERFTTAPPARGEWTVPPVVARHTLPETWRFLLVLPDTDPGRSGAAEDASMRRVVEGADPAIADELAGVLTRRVLPAAAEGDRSAFGAAVAAFSRRNGAWYADAQGGVYRPPAGRIVEALRASEAVAGVGQSSWGPAVWGVTDERWAGAARAAGRAALDAAGVGGEVLVAAPRNVGARRTVPDAEAGDSVN